MTPAGLHVPRYLHTFRWLNIDFFDFSVFPWLFKAFLIENFEFNGQVMEIDMSGKFLKFASLNFAVFPRFFFRFHSIFTY